MKCFFILSIQVIFVSLLNAQVSAVALDRMNVLYAEIENPITIAVENTNCKNLIIKTNNGTIKGVNGRYTIQPTELGYTTISVSQKNKNKQNQIGVWSYQVKSIPYPTFKIGSNRTLMPKIELVNQLYVRAELDESFGFDIRFAIDSFSIFVSKVDTCFTKEIPVVGNKITPEATELFNKLETGDIVLFRKIFSKSIHNEVISLNPVLYISLSN